MGDEEDVVDPVQLLQHATVIDVEAVRAVVLKQKLLVSGYLRAQIIEARCRLLIAMYVNDLHEDSQSTGRNRPALPHSAMKRNPTQTEVTKDNIAQSW